VISFDRVRIENFRSYKNVDIEFTSSSGVILMSGDNGTGKSTLLNAICWCLYADTPFYAIEDSPDIINKFAAENAHVEVELSTTIDGSKYVFTRRAERGGRGGILHVNYEDNGNWSSLDGASVEDAVKRLLPKDLRHLFFFNGEQIKEIFKPGNHDGLKTSVHKVSEIDLIEKAKLHLSKVEDNYLHEISKSNKNAKAIVNLQTQIEKLKHEIQNAEKTIELFNDKIALREDTLTKLDKQIESTASAREMLRQKKILEADLAKAEAVIENCESDKQEILQNNLHRALLKNEFQKYEEVLSKAEEDGLIPPPIKPEVTRRILDTGICICGQHLDEEQRQYIKDQHREYEQKSELQYLTEGIYTKRAVTESLKNDTYKLRDAMNVMTSVITEKIKLQEDIGKINDNLDIANFNHDDPESRRNDLRAEISQHMAARGRQANQLDTLNRELREDEQDLKAIIDKDTATEALENKRRYTQILIGWLNDAGENMEVSIRKKLKKSAKDVFFSILPETDFTDIDINKGYVVTLLSENGVTYSTNNLSTGQAKSLGLSLAYSLSKDLGYSTTPLLIDNLYGDISESHHLEVTKMISILSKEKQIVIMDLSAHKTRQMFSEGVIKQVFNISKGEGDHFATIEEGVI
jgi:DNA sulfur modification protein DndD